MTPRAAFLALTAAASVRAAGFLDQGCAAASQSQPGSASWSLDGSRLSAQCDDHVCGARAPSVLDLNLCLGNDQGKLVARKNGNFADSCRDCQVSNDFGSLICACDDVSKGVTRISQLDLKADNTVYNWYGYLSCFGAHDAQAAPHDFSHCGAAAPAAGVRDPLSCDGCVSAPVHGVVGNQQQQAGQKQATKAGGRRAGVRPQWKTPAAAAVVDDSVQAPAVQKGQKQNDGIKTEQEPRNVVTPEQVNIQQEPRNAVTPEQVKIQQEPRNIVTPFQDQVKAATVNEETQGSFHARRNSNGAQGKTSTDTTQAGPAVQVQAAPAQVQDPRPNGIQDVQEPRYANVAGQPIDSRMMSPTEHAAYMHGMMNAAAVYGQVPRPVTDQRQAQNVQDTSAGQYQGAYAQKVTPEKSRERVTSSQGPSTDPATIQGYKGGERVVGEQRPSQSIQGTHAPVSDAPNVMMAPRGIQLGGGPVEGMGPAVLIVDGRQ